MRSEDEGRRKQQGVPLASSLLSVLSGVEHSVALECLLEFFESNEPLGER